MRATTRRATVYNSKRVAAGTRAILVSNLIAYWPGNEAAGANNLLDLHTNALHLTHVGSPGSDAGKVYAGARYISDAAMCFRRDSEALLETGDVDWAAALWVYLTVSVRAHTLLAKANTGTYGEFSFSVNNGLAACNLSCTTTTGYKDISLAVSVPLNTWTLLILQHTAAAKTFTLYKNADVGVVSSAYTGTINVTSDAFSIGDWGVDTSYSMRGRIGPVALWKNRVLDADARAYAWNAGAGWAYADNPVLAAPSPVLVTFGDSITEGYSSTDEAHRWANIVAADIGAVLVNSGVSGTTLQNSVQNSVATIGAATDGNGRDTYAARILAFAPTYVIILYGINDVRLDDAGFSAAAFQNDLDEIVVALIAGGVLADNIVLCSPPWMDSDYYGSYAPFDGATSGKYADYTTAVATVVTNRSTRYANVFQAMADGGGVSLMSADHVHPNDSGHAVIAATILAAMA